VRRGAVLCRERRVDAIVASGPPFSAVLAGALLRDRTGRPFVADFRDAWVQDPDDPFGTIGGTFRAPHGKLRHSTLSRLERYVLDRTDLALFTSDTTEAAYRHAYPKLDGRSLVLYNGVDENDFRETPPLRSRFTFAYAGTLHDYQLEQLEVFLRAFAAAIQRDRRMTDCDLYVVGQRSSRIDARLSRLASELAIAERVIRDPPVSQPQALAALRSSHVLVLFCGRNRFIRQGKISSYLASGRPILALADPASETAQHVLRAGHSVSSEETTEHLAARILELFTKHRADVVATDRPFPFAHPHPLNWRTSAERLAVELQRIAEPAARRI
jgi:glycosyltransferase involved in cell wall biosynthesis